MPDVVGPVALSISCLTGCIKGLVLLSKAKHYNRDVLDVRLRTELTLHVLTTWAEEAGLMEDPPTLLMSANNAFLVPVILGQLENLVLDLNQLRQRYGLDLQLTSDNVEALYDNESGTTRTVIQREQWTQRAVAIFRKRSEPWKRIRWVTLDDKKFDHLLDKIKMYISEMEKFLEQAKQDSRDRHLEFCLRETILNTKGQQELGIIGTEYGKAPSKVAIAAAAKLKRTRLMLGFLDPAMTPTIAPLPKSSSTGSIPRASSASEIGPKTMKLSMRLLTLSEAARAQPFRTLARYDDRVVLLEWKHVKNMADAHISKRVDQVAALLQDLGSSFHSLRCRGYVTNNVENRYGYIFDLPEELVYQPRAQPATSAVSATHPALELKSLRQLLGRDEKPSLNMRLSLAVKLLENLLNLHTSGWLHKELRSDNVIFTRGANHTHGSVEDDLSTYSMYVAGYIYSRVDSPGEMTEPLQSELEADLYRHPSLLWKARQPYHKSLDIFSVGCILLEIGLWSSIRQILVYYSSFPSHVAPSSLPARLIPDMIPMSSNTVGLPEGGSESAKKASLDLMQLRYDLILASVATADTKLTSHTVIKRNVILNALEAAVGRKYTSVVKDFLAASDRIDDTGADEHEFALDLEMRARDTIQDLAGAV